MPRYRSKLLVWHQDQPPPLVNYVAIMKNLQGSLPIVATSPKETRELILDLAEVPDLPERTLMLFEDLPFEQREGFGTA